MKKIFKLSKLAIVLSIFMYGAGIFAFAYMRGYHWPWNATDLYEVKVYDWINNLMVAGLIGYRLAVGTVIRNLKRKKHRLVKMLSAGYDDHIDTLAKFAEVNEDYKRVKEFNVSISDNVRTWINKYFEQKDRAIKAEQKNLTLVFSRDIEKTRLEGIIEGQGGEIAGLKEINEMLIKTLPEGDIIILPDSHKEKGGKRGNNKKSNK